MAPDHVASLQQPEPVPLADLSFEELRGYRDALRAEADRVSYWRRVTHGRMDLLSAQTQMGSPLAHDQLARALADTGSGDRRRGLLSVAAADPLPDLPHLDGLWSAEVDPTDQDAVGLTLVRLRAAEHQLNEYRDALHCRVDEATVELLDRYRAQPSRALDLLDRRRSA
jgi:hypothetical protein